MTATPVCIECAQYRLLTAIDEVVLPDMTLAGKDISFTVVIGRVLGAYTPDGET